MIENKKLILIGGTGRNVGKTEFVCRLISMTAKKYDVYALKVSAIFPDEDIFHGNHEGAPESQILFEETRGDTSKDTSRMLRAGAKKVFYLQSDDRFIKKGYSKFCDLIPQDAIVVCESSSLQYHVKPGLHVIVTNSGATIKPRAKKLLDFADIVITSNGQEGFRELERFSFDSNNDWILKS